MVDVDKLHGKVVQNKYNWTTFAKALNVDRTTLHRKLKSDGEKLTVGEVNKIVSLLNLNKDEAIDIFLAKQSHKTRQ